MNITTEHPLVLVGQYGSPYTLKMRAVLRYRHIPFRWVLRDSKWDDIPTPPVPLIPVIVYPNEDGSHGEATVDSSPQIMRLEAEFADRSTALSCVSSHVTIKFLVLLCDAFESSAEVSVPGDRSLYRGTCFVLTYKTHPATDQSFVLTNSRSISL